MYTSDMIEVAIKEAQMELEKKIEGTIVKAVKSVDVTVNKDKVKELIELDKAIQTKELGRTVKDMISDNYEDRLRAEYNQLKLRRDKLQLYLEKHNSLNTTNEPEVKSSTNLLIAQVNAMSAYLNILRERLDQEGISIKLW